MSEVVNPKPKFVPMDIVRILKTGELGLITDTMLNDCQVEDKHQWSFSLTPLIRNSTVKWAWYDMDELELVNNVVEILTRPSRMHANSFALSMDGLRRES